jgi:hypothetical protein
MSKQPKNLSLSTLKKQNAKTYKDKKQIHFANGDKLDIDLVFQPTKVENVLQEMLQVVDEVSKRKNGEDIDISVWSIVMMSSIIKNFTSIETDALGLDGLVELRKQLKDAKYYDDIIGAFDEIELNNAVAKINEMLQLMTKQIGLMKEKQELVESDEEAVEESGE